VLAVIKHIVDDNFAFQQQSWLAHGVGNTVGLLQCKTSFSPEVLPNSSELFKVLQDGVTQQHMSYILST